MFKRKNIYFPVLISLYLLLNILIWKQITNQIATDRQETIKAAIKNNNNLVVSLEQHTLRTIRDADAAIKLVKFEYQDKGNKIDFKELAQSGLLGLPLFDGLAITDKTGKVIHYFPETLEAKSLNISDREAFNVLKNAPDSMYISTPFQSRTIYKSVITINRSIKDDDGNFKGIISLQMQPAVFMSFYNQASINKNDILSLISTNGITYSRRTGNKVSSGENIIKSPLFTHIKNKAVNNYYARDAIKNIPTYFSYRKLSQYPIIATVGTSEQDVLENFNERKLREYLFGAILSLILFVFFVTIILALRQRKKALQLIRKSETRYRSVFQKTHDAIFLLQPNGCVEAMNNAACKLFEMDIKAGAGVYFSQMFEKTEPEIDFVFDQAKTLSFNQKEIKFYCLNNKIFIGEVSYSSFFDGDGKSKIILVIKDITQRKQYEKKLQRHQKRYQQDLTKQIIIAQERERELIGHELHDNVNQILTTVKLYLEMALNHKETQHELIKKSIKYILQSINEIRSLSHSLSAPTLGTQSLVDSIVILTHSIASCTDLKIITNTEDYNHNIDKEQSLAIYRIVQEQLNNIVKHASATEVYITLKQDKNETHLIIEDNGKGFDTNAKRKGIGLNNIISRTKAFNGKYSIKSQQGRGCNLSISLPNETISTLEEEEKLF